MHVAEEHHLQAGRRVLAQEGVPCACYWPCLPQQPAMMPVLTLWQQMQECSTCTCCCGAARHLLESACCSAGPSPPSHASAAVAGLWLPQWWDAALGQDHPTLGLDQSPPGCSGSCPRSPHLGSAWGLAAEQQQSSGRCDIAGCCVTCRASLKRV